MEFSVPSAVARAAALLEKHPVSWTRPSGGYTPADRYVVRFSDGMSCFAKAATNEYTARCIRSEYALVYSRINAPFLARVLGFEDDELPLLVLEDLSGAHWPPPWSPTQVHAVLETLKEVRGTQLSGLPPGSALGELESGTWATLARDPGGFLALELCSETWLERALPFLLEHEEAGISLSRQGDDLMHLDVRSDNLCIFDGRVVLVDWNWAARGNGQFDLAFFLPSLHSEGGPLPEEVLPDAPHWAATVSGFFAARAGLPMVPGGPRVREVQLSQLKSALPWAQRALGLPPLDGPNA